MDKDKHKLGKTRDEKPEGFYDTDQIFEPVVKYDVRIDEWIDKNQLHKCLEDFSPGIKGIQSFLKECMPKPVSYTHLTLPTSDLV